QAHVARGCGHRLNPDVLLGVALINGVLLGREFLVPETHVQPRVRRMAIRAGVGTRAADRRFAARTQVMHPQDIASHLPTHAGRTHHNCQAGHQNSQPHGLTSLPAVPCGVSLSLGRLSGFFWPMYWNTCTRRLYESTTNTRSSWSMNI